MYLNYIILFTMIHKDLIVGHIIKNLLTLILISYWTMYLFLQKWKLISTCLCTWAKIYLIFLSLSRLYSLIKKFTYIYKTNTPNAALA